MIDRPLDLLNNSKGKKIIVYCKENKVYSGKLLAFDLSINLSLDETKELENGNVTKNYGLAFIRGDTVKFISPGEK